MKCLHCGYCCKNLSVIIVDNPIRGVVSDNLIHHLGNGKPCKHLVVGVPGEYRCNVHNEPWYIETPCYAHIQIEDDEETLCRMGLYVLKSKKEGLKWI